MCIFDKHPLNCTLALMALLSVAACSDDPVAQTHDDLGPIETVVDEVARTVWPGVDRDDGSRYIRRINGFIQDEPVSYWFVGFASRLTADVFFFCRKSDKLCPLDVHGRLAPDTYIGNPVFARIPGEAGYSPFWLMWVVRVPDDYEPNELKSAKAIEQATADGRVEVKLYVYDHKGVIGPTETIMHCLLVLAGTALEDNGADAVGKKGEPTVTIPVRKGWHKQYRVNFFDFSFSERVFSPDDVTESRAYMPISDIFVLFRDCKNGSTAPVCKLTNAELLGAISERGVETDINQDGDKTDTNNVIVAAPGMPPANPIDKVYSPLWRVNVVRVIKEHESKITLMDDSGDQNGTEIKSIKSIRERAAEGIFAEPAFMSEAMAGNAIPGNDGKVFFNCPAQPAAALVMP